MPPFHGTMRSARRQVEAQPPFARGMVERVGRGEVAHLVVYVAEAAEAHGVGVQHRLVFTFRGEECLRSITSFYLSDIEVVKS